MVKIRQTPEPIKDLPQKKKVAAYARISMETELMFHSFSAQVSHYSQLIQSNPDWQYAGVYADRGISGTGTKKRAEFNRMIADCEAGKIDIILCVHAGCPGSPFSRAMSTGTNDYDCYITRWHISQLLVPIFLFSFYTDSDIGILQSTS